MDNNEKLNQLFEKLDMLVKRQHLFWDEITQLREEISSIKSQESSPKVEPSATPVILPVEQAIVKEPSIILESEKILHQQEKEKSLVENLSIKTDPFLARPPKESSNFEKFIGENLINKIGIIITIIGVAIGAKYSIENELVSPLTRIVMGYLTGLGLLAFGLKLKKNYENYSAVLVSGAMANFYFITFSAYSFYGLIPQMMSFGLMVIFTAFTIVAAINYNKQVIAHIGLVGAYVVPFLLSDGSGNYVALYTYMAIINTGILIISFKRYWKSLYYASFGLTWLIFSGWTIANFSGSIHLQNGLLFASIFFAIFYCIFLAYKLIKKEVYNSLDILMLFANSFIFYGLGYYMLNSTQTGQDYLGLYTVGNALIHFIVGSIIYRQKLGDRNLFYLVAGLVLAFITIAIPVQLDGNWVTLLWAFEAALLFWIGRTKQVPVYENLSYPLMILAFLSIGQDLSTVYNNYYISDDENRIQPLVNIHFLSSVLFITAFGFINYLNGNKKYTPSKFASKFSEFLNTFIVPGILLVITYFAFRVELSSFFNQLFIDSNIEIQAADQDFKDSFYDQDLKKYQTIWLINYTLLFLFLLSLINLKKIKSSSLGLLTTGLTVVAILAFLTLSLYALSDLRESYLNQTLAQYYKRTNFNIWIRYITFVFVALGMRSIYQQMRSDLLKPTSKIYFAAFDLFLSLTILWILSSELITWMEVFSFPQSYKLGLSILWGIYSLILISIGIWKKKQHLRIGAIVLFAVTLIKLFFYDISHLDTIAKTIVFVSLGVLLLIISFLYNKFKNLIADDEEN